MFQSLVEYRGSPACYGSEREHGCKAGLAQQWQRLAAATAVFWSAAAMCVFAVDANVEISEGRNRLLRSYLVKQVEQQSLSSGNNLATIENASGLPEAPFFTASELTQCREKTYRFCRDLTQSEFRMTSLRFMVPEVRGLSPKSLSIRRNSVVANYTFR